MGQIKLTLLPNKCRYLYQMLRLKFDNANYEWGRVIQGKNFGVSRCILFLLNLPTNAKNICSLLEKEFELFCKCLHLDSWYVSQTKHLGWIFCYRKRSRHQISY